MLAERLDDRNSICWGKRIFQDGGIAEQNVQLQQHQFANDNRAGRGGERCKESAGVTVFRAILVERVKQQVRRR
jgi:hypothetical protein